MTHDGQWTTPRGMASAPTDELRAGHRSTGPIAPNWALRLAGARNL